MATSVLKRLSYFGGSWLPSMVGNALKVLRVNAAETNTEFVALTKLLLWYKADVLSTGTNVSSRIDVPFSGTITKARAYAKTAPVGANLVLDINKNGTSIWNITPANQITIIASANTGSQTSFDTTAVAVDDYFTLDIDGVGSGTAGSDLTVELEISLT